jgi:hypothetical protein
MPKLQIKYRRKTEKPKPYTAAEKAQAEERGLELPPRDPIIHLTQLLTADLAGADPKAEALAYLNANSPDRFTVKDFEVLSVTPLG